MLDFQGWISVSWYLKQAEGGRYVLWMGCAFFPKFLPNYPTIPPSVVIHRFAQVPTCLRALEVYVGT